MAKSEILSLPLPKPFKASVACSLCDYGSPSYSMAMIMAFRNSPINPVPRRCDGSTRIVDKTGNAIFDWMIRNLHDGVP